MEAFKIPLAFSPVHAGFPSPADDYSEGHLDIHKHLVKRPASTIFFKAQDDSMYEYGIILGDIVIIDRSLKPINNKIILLEIDGERVLRCYINTQGRGRLAVGKKIPAYQEIDTEEGLHIIGVATYVIHHV